MEFRWFCRQLTETLLTDPNNKEELLYANGSFLPKKAITQSELGKLSNRKSNEIWELVQIGGSRQKIKKVPSFSWEKFKIRGGSPHFQKVPSFSWEKFKTRGGSSEIKKVPRFRGHKD